MDIMKSGKQSNYLGAWDLYDHQNGKIQVTIKEITEEEIMNNRGGKEPANICYFIEDIKPMVLNITNKKTLAKLFKTVKSEKLVGKRIEIGFEAVNAFGKTADALRISKMLIPQNVTALKIKCQECGKDIEPRGKSTSEQLANYTLQKYGKKLCSACATTIANSLKEQNENVDE